MVDDELPSLLAIQGTTSLAVVLNPTDTRAFTLNSDRYVSQSFLGDSLATSGSGYVYTDTLGDQIYFYGFGTEVPSAQRGQFEKRIDSTGQITEVSSIDSSGAILEIERETANESVVEKWEYSYYSSPDPNAGMLSGVQLEQSDGEGGWVIARQVVYTYYTGTVAAGTAQNGALGDLKTAVIEDGSGNAIDATYYRYYIAGEANGYSDALKYVFDGDAYAQLANAYTDPDAATDLQVAPFADHYFQYDSERRITLHAIQGAGSSDSGGLGTYTYSYSSSANPEGTNSWRYKTIETLPNNNQNIVYCNSLGEVMLKVLVDYNGTSSTEDDQSYPTYYRFDDDGRIVWTASTSALEPYSASTSDSSWEDYSDLVGYSAGSFANILPTTGRIDVNQYYNATTASSMDAGGVAGYLWYQAVQRGYEGTEQSITGLTWSDGTAQAVVSGSNYNVGDIVVIRGVDQSEFDGSFVITDVSGSTFSFGLSDASTSSPTGSTMTVDRPIVTNSKSYISNTSDDITIYVVKNNTIYQGDDQTDKQTTVFDYGWYGGTNGEEYSIINYPIVSSGNNGPGGSTNDTNTTFYDIYGRPIWTKDAAGHVNYMAYDLVTGSVIKQIVDVTYSTLTPTEKTSFDATGWTDPTGGLNLTTAYQVDPLGRIVEEADPNGNITYYKYNDVAHEIRVYQGWHQDSISGDWSTTGPIEIIREYRGATPFTDSQGNAVGTVYTETLTISASPSASDTPSGTETVDAYDIQSLTRSLTNNAGQVVEVDDYFSMAGLTFSQTSPQLDPTTGTGISDDSSSGNYHQTLYAYDDQGLLGRIEDSTGTITRYINDARENISQIWVGTDDLPTSGEWSPVNTDGTNLVKVQSNAFDTDGNLTVQIESPGGGENDREADNYYDWRNRLVASKSGAEDSESTGVGRLIVYYVYNNQNQVINQETFAGDGVNISDDDSDGVPDVPSSSLRRSDIWTDYDEQGRVYRTKEFSIDPATGGTSTYTLNTDYYYDSRANIIETRSPGGLVTKTTYDGANRPTVVFETDGAGGTSYSHAGNITGDHALQRITYTYDKDGNVIETALIKYGTGGGTYYTSSLYDAANRDIADVNLGTNSGTGLTLPLTSIPTRSDSVLVTSYSYDDGGRLQDTTDPRSIVMRNSYDLLGRVTETIADYTDGTPTDNSNQTTDYTYDGSDHVLTMTAVLPDDTFQTTAYIYGASQSTGSDINSNNLLSAIEYPDLSTGSASSSQKESFTYNSLGQQTNYADRNGTIHAYTYDVLGREIADTVTTLGSGVDGTVRQLSYSFNDAGLPKDFTSEAASQSISSGNLVSSSGTATVTLSGHGYSVGEYVEISGADQTEYDHIFEITSASSGTFSFAIAGSPAATATGTISVRLVLNQVEDVYNGLGQLTIEYQSHDGAVDTATTPKTQYVYSEMASGANHSRLTEMIYPDGREEDYVYNTGTDANISRVSSIWDHTGGSLTEIQSYTYIGLGNVYMVSSNANPDLYTPGGPDDYGPIHLTYTATYDRFDRLNSQTWLYWQDSYSDYMAYAYDRDSNVTSRNLATSTPADGAAYLNFNTYTPYDNLNRLTSYSWFISGDGWGDELTGSQSWDLDASGNWTSQTTNGTTVDRSYNFQNELTEVGPSTVTYDDNGNLTAYLSTGYSYDAWGRLVQISTGSTDTDYGYDAMGRRIAEGSPSSPTHLYYSPIDGQVIEEQDDSGVTKTQYVWSAAQPGVLVLRDSDIGSGGDYGMSGSGLDQRLWAEVDNQGSVIGLIPDVDNIAEHFQYDPYGNVTVYDGTWNVLSGGDAFGFKVLYQGQRYDAANGLYDFHARVYSPSLGRFMQQDPMGYVDGANRYQFVRSNPLTYTDPMGLCADQNAAAQQKAISHFQEVAQGIESGYISGSGAADVLTAVRNELVNAGIDPSKVATALNPYAKQLAAQGYQHSNDNHIYTREERLQGSLSILTSTFSGGLTDQVGLTNSSQYSGTAFDLARAAAETAYVAANFLPAASLAGEIGVVTRTTEVVEQEVAAAEGTTNRIPRSSDGSSMATDDALDAAENYLGPDYKQASPGRYVSADGTRQVRMTDSDLSSINNHAGAPHMNFEEGQTIIKPNGKSSFVPSGNSHVYLPEE